MIEIQGRQHWALIEIQGRQHWALLELSDRDVVKQAAIVDKGNSRKLFTHFVVE